MDLDDYGMEALEYGVESSDVLYESSEAVNSSVSSPSGMEVSAIIALLAGSAYFGYRKSKNFRQELENEYLED